MEVEMKTNEASQLRSFVSPDRKTISSIGSVHLGPRMRVIEAAEQADRVASSFKTPKTASKSNQNSLESNFLSFRAR